MIPFIGIKSSSCRIQTKMNTTTRHIIYRSASPSHAAFDTPLKTPSRESLACVLFSDFVVLILLFGGVVLASVSFPSSITAEFFGTCNIDFERLLAGLAGRTLLASVLGGVACEQAKDM